ncbi:MULTISPECIES: M14 family zinc carboxypeptidase [unclassified Streptomyces]|uniref:M14 family zinc carboxypeptidase n=1 Tax=unclassified Streptomyces TaxID=2593676 RepID=UPI00224DA870|nr:MULTISPECIES: M14 family zinc carboxypeptidase [unclassified Streptomyces]MCX5328965.1 M14 family zinc carboxypeptidase [Streptomyces sp. NBC_00140]MCX5358376.1 M14 family zinc carboxypeptidase [Streptomyces sp. NBC_00124]
MYRTVAQLDSLTSTLANWFPQLCTRVRLPERSVQGRDVFALRMRSGSGTDRRGVLLVGGTHSRELMNPDALVELAVDLVVSRLNGTDIVYGGRTWSAQDVKLILETLDVWIVPCINPDGRQHVLTVDGMWRKNLRDNPGTACDGVDLNRNAAILWGVTEGQTSCSPCSDVYAGPGAFSEPETRNVKHLLDTRTIHTFADVHSYSELVLYPWGHAFNQSTDPAQRFTTLPTGTCAPIGIPGYQEYITVRDQQRFETVAGRIVDAIAAVRGRAYTPQTGRALYATTGTQSDYAYSRHIANPALGKTYGFTFETGPRAATIEDSFHPADPTLIKRDAKSGLMALAQQSICAFDLIGLKLLGRRNEVDALRTVRDDALAKTEAGREWITLIERVELPLAPLLSKDERLAAKAAKLLARAGQLVTDAKEQVGDGEIDLGLDLVRELDARGEAEDGEVRADLKAISALLDRLRGLRPAEVVEHLTSRGPRDG